MPSLGGGDCLAIVRLEGATLIELASIFLDLAKEYEVPVGTVVVISATTHLSRVGLATYANDLIKSLNMIKVAYGGSVRTVHGFPIIHSGLGDASTVRSLREVEYWLGEVDKRNAHSLPRTSAYFVRNLYSDQSRPLRPTPRGDTLPSNLSTLDMMVFESPGWENLASDLPTLAEKDELKVVRVLIGELNDKFALQLDPNPSTARFGSVDNSTEFNESRFIIALAGSSHASRLQEPLASTHLQVVDVSVPGFRISERAVSSMVSDMEAAISGLPDHKTIVLIQPFDNSIFFASKARGEKILTRKGSDGKYHVEGELKMVSKEDMKNMFLETIPMIKAAKGKKVLIMGPLPRYIYSRCCRDQSHCTNFGRHDYVDTALQALREVYGWLNSYIFMRRMKDVKVFNPISAMGFLDGKVTTDTLTTLWGPDPVHPSQEAYYQIAAKLTEVCDDIFAGEPKKKLTTKPAFKRPAERSAWISNSQPVAKRFIPSAGPGSSHFRARGGGGGGAFTTEKRGGHNAAGRGGGQKHYRNYGAGSGSGSGYGSAVYDGGRGQNRGGHGGRGGGGNDGGHCRGRGSGRSRFYRN